MPERIQFTASPGSQAVFNPGLRQSDQADVVGVEVQVGGQHGEGGD